MNSVQKLFVTVVLAAVAQGAYASSDSEAVITAVEKFGEAYQQADVEVLRQMLAPGYVHVNGGSGNRIDAEQWLDWVSSQRALIDAGELRISSYEISDTKVEMMGHSAIVTGVVSSSGVREGALFETRIRFTNLWTLVDGNWKRAAFHDSPLPTQFPHAFQAGWEGEDTCELLFEHPSVRVGRCVFPPGVGHEKHYHNPHFGYTLEGSDVRISDASGDRELTTSAGTTWTSDSLTVHQTMNIGDTETSYLIIEPLSTQVVSSDDEATLRHFKTVLWPQAYRTQDEELLDQLLHDSFELIDAEGNRSTKEGELEFVRNNQWNPPGFEYRIERLAIYPAQNMAIIDGRGVARDYEYASSNVLIKVGDNWRAVSSHVSGLKEITAAND